MTTTRRAAIGGWLHRRAENVAVALIATMFVCFLLQIAFRYLLNQPLGWTEEVTVLCWLWGVLVVRGVRRVRRRGDPLRPRLRRGPRARSADLHGDQQHRVDRPARDFAPRHLALRDLHEARALSLPAHAVRLPVFDLSDLRRCLHREARPAGMDRHHRGRRSSRAGVAGAGVPAHDAQRLHAVHHRSRHPRDVGICRSACR